MEEVDEMIILNYCRELQEICQQLDTSTNVCYATKCRSLEKLHLIIDAGMHVRDREEVIQSLLHDINSICLPVMCEYLMDSRERCRELAVQILSNIIDVFSVSDEYASCIVPIIANRLSNSSTLIEQSEEIRLSLVLLVKTIICKRSVNLTDYLEYLIQILVRTLVDPCSKVRRESCICVVELSSALPQHFHRHADFLIEPLLRTLTHKHSQIRSECVKALGTAFITSTFFQFVSPAS